MENYEQANAIRRSFRLIKSSEQGFNFGLINWMVMLLIVAMIFAGVASIFE